MLIQRLHKSGISSDVMQVLGFGSILASIAIWRKAKESSDANHAERLGIFIGLWAPTFFVLADQLVNVEAAEKNA